MIMNIRYQALYIFILLFSILTNAHATDPGVCFKMYDVNGVESYEFELGEYIEFDASCTSSNLTDDHRAWFVPDYTEEADPEQPVYPLTLTPCFVGVLQPVPSVNVYYYAHNSECPFYTGAIGFSTSYFKEGTYVMRLDMTDENYKHEGTSPVYSNYTMSKQFTVGRAGSSTCLEDGFDYCEPLDLAWLVPTIKFILN